MVVMCGPVFDAVESVRQEVKEPPLLVMLTPQGEQLTQAAVREFSRVPHLCLLCGHYEGFDERIRIGLKPREVSIGDYVLSGGEAAAMVLVDSVVRLLPGVLGNAEGPANDSFSAGLLEHPQYTRPRTFRGMSVPDLLLQGHHEEIDRWRRDQSIDRTRKRRPDLPAAGGLPDGDGGEVPRESR